MSSEDEDVRIGARLHELRKSHEFTQNDFAKSLGVSLRAYQSYERGENPISRKLITSLATIYEVDFAWLFGGDEYERKQKRELKKQNPPGIGRLLQWGKPTFISVGEDHPHIQVEAGERDIDVFLEGLQYIESENENPSEKIVEKINDLRKHFSDGASDNWKPRLVIEVYLSSSGIQLLSYDHYLQDAIDKGELEPCSTPQLDLSGPFYYADKS